MRGAVIPRMVAARKAFRWFLVVALFCTYQQGATHRGALQQELRASRLPTVALSGVVSVDVIIPHTQEPPPILPKICKVRRPHPAFIFPAFMGFPFPIQAGGSPIRKRRPPCQQSPTPARLSPYAGAVPPHVSTAPTTLYACADPHRFSRLPICFHDSPIQSPSSKNPDIGLAETSVPGPANQAPAGLYEFPAATAGAVPHVQTGHQLAETSVRFTQTYASNRFTQIPCANDGVRSLGVSDDTASATTGRRAARRLRVGLKAGPGTAAHLKAGN